LSNVEVEITQKANRQIDELTRQQAMEAAGAGFQNSTPAFKVSRIAYWDNKREEVRVQAELAIKEARRRMAEGMIQAQSSKDEAQRRAEQAAYESLK
jgi:hypothetical protein